MADTAPIGNEKDIVKKLKRELESWREIILHLNSVLIWEKSWYPGMIAGVSTVVFTLLWAADPSLLSALSSALLLVTLLDYLVPTLSTSLFSPASWTASKEKQLEEICRNLAHAYSLTSYQVIAFKDLKLTSPKLYYSVTIITLTLLAYIGNKVNNLVLTYFLVTALLLMPGLSHHGLLQKYYKASLSSVVNLLKSLQGGDKTKVN